MSNTALLVLGRVKKSLLVECRVGLESQNQSFIQTEQPPDGSIPEITAGVAESALLDNKNLRENALFCSIK